jgi:multimeric flavodoxin WrbA
MLKMALEKNHKVEYFPISEMKMAHCLGCWDCWTKTPGICRLKDDGVEYLKSVISADLVLYASPVSAGFLTSETKKALDRIIPELLPHIRINKGECHHKKRYDHARSVGFILLDQDDIEPEAREIINEIIDRIGLNMQPESLLKLNLKSDNIEDIYNEINNI